MKERPIIFKAEMVRAILAGRKTQARSPVEPQPLAIEREFRCDDGQWFGICPNNPENDDHPTRGNYFRCPYGQPGDRLWVKEAWGSLRMDGRNEPIAIHRTAWEEPAEHELIDVVWLPADAMPRYASRITLELTDVGVAQLQDITCGGYLYQSEVRREGCPFDNDANLMGADEMDWFKQAWDAQHAAAGHGWEANPWIWVLDFQIERMING